MPSPNFCDLTGKRFGLLTVTSLYSSGERTRWDCVCDCGVKTHKEAYSLKTGKTSSCGCQSSRLKTGKDRPSYEHGHSGSLTYESWEQMWARCTNPNSTGYDVYKDRTPPFAWKDFSVFLADMGERPSKFHSLERSKNYLPYGPDNCEWATRKEQNRNKSNNVLLTYKGESKLLVEWAEELDIKYQTLYMRIYTYKWSVERAFETPVRIDSRNQDESNVSLFPE